MERALPVTSPALRAARSGAVAAAAVGASLGGHVLAGAESPPPAAVAAFTVAVAALTTALSRLRWTPARLLGALAVAQGGFHLAFGQLAAAHPPGHGLSMLLWHLTASAVTCVVVLRAEAWLWQVLRGLRSLPPSGRSPAAPPTLVTQRAEAAHARRGRRSHRLRAPPRPALV